MDNTQLRRLNKITYILQLVMKEFQLGFFQVHVDAYTSDPDNHPHLLEVYEKIEKLVKET